MGVEDKKWSPSKHSNKKVEVVFSFFCFFGVRPFDFVHLHARYKYIVEAETTEGTLRQARVCDELYTYIAHELFYVEHPQLRAIHEQRVSDPNRRVTGTKKHHQREQTPNGVSTAPR